MNEDAFLIAPEVERYCEEHTSAETETLQQLARETNLKMLTPQMLSGKIQGRFLTMMVEMMKPKTILELGTFTGYSAICMAQALPENGLLITIDGNPEVEYLAQKYFSMSGLENKIRFINGDALHIIPTLNMTFDMAYIDADKDHLSEHYQAVMKKMNAGGVIIVDNILWYGKVIDSQQNDRTTQKIRQFNNMIQDDNRVTNVLLPLRDGVMMIKVDN